MTTEKSYVGMYNCFYCNEPAGVVLDRRLQDTLPKNIGVINHEPCSKCAALMKQGVLLISVDESKIDDPKNPWRSGGWCVVTDACIRRMVTPESLATQILKHRVAFVPDEMWDALELPRSGTMGSDIPASQ